ncbi:hypothetical protein [Sphingorhabdus profundilacus]|uniref:hypothetical protein n=1 Tax=Sphingorhabdus profundilacus TaxID=2509718 RepID=UPI001FE7AC6B|nr:hypothetical protein [Sphingorhabdus profundilacus]
MKKMILIGLLATAMPFNANAQTAPAPANTTISVKPLVSEPGPDASTRVVRGGAQVRVQFLHEITTEDKASKVGDRPRLEVAENVVVDGVTVIPKGTPVVGELTAVRNKGMWGKSGKLEGRVLNMTLNGRTVRMSGAFDDKGVTGTAGVVAAVAFVPVVGFFVTGTSARIPAGGQVSAFIDEDIVFTVTPASAPAPMEVAAPTAADTTTAVSPANN